MNIDSLMMLAGWLAAVVATIALVYKVLREQRKEEREENFHITRLQSEVDANNRMLKALQEQYNSFLQVHNDTLKRMESDRRDFFKSIEASNKEHREAVDKLRTEFSRATEGVYERINKLTDSKQL